MLHTCWTDNFNAHETSVDNIGQTSLEFHQHEADYTTVQYARHLGATAIAPGFKKISPKVKRYISQEPPPIFDSVTGMPNKEILPKRWTLSLSTTGKAFLS